jgi:hypothetical protein
MQDDLRVFEPINQRMVPVLQINSRDDGHSPGSPGQSGRRSTRFWWNSSILAGALVGLLCSPVQAAENATSFFIGGTKGPLAGITPPPGVFFSNTVYYYSASAGATLEVPVNGRLVTGVDASLLMEVPTILWVTDAKIFGGRLAFAVTAPFGGLDIDVAAELSRPGGTRSRSISDSITTFADPILTSFIGWESGHVHVQAGVSVNVPIGDYQEGELANIALHHWATDINMAVTWADPAVGWDLSATMGVIFNGENSATDYTTGNEFHFEFAASKYFSKEFFVGLTGYYYDQFTGDSGAGAVLGDFEGRVAALGFVAGYTFHAGQLPIATNVRYYHEFDVENRLEGDGFFLNVAIPLAISGH